MAKLLDLNHSLTHSQQITILILFTFPTHIISTFRVAGTASRASRQGLRRALSPLVPLAFFLVAGAVARASRKGCGARCRRWLSSWQAQYPEPPEGAAARVVAAGAACCLPRGGRSVQSLQKGLRRALSPLVPLAVFLVAGAVSRAFTEGAAARVVAAGAAGCPRGSTQSLQKELRRASSPVPLAVLMAGAVPRASRRGCCAALSPLVPSTPRCRRWCRRSVQSLQQGCHCDCALLPLWFAQQGFSLVRNRIVMAAARMFATCLCALLPL